MLLYCVMACLLGTLIRASPAEEKLLQSLFRSYHSNSRPVLHTKHTLALNLSFTLVSIDRVDIDNNDISVQGWLKLQWKDVQLRWNVSEHEGLRSLHIPIEKMWKPDIKVYNGPDAAMDPTLAIVESDGSVLWVPPLKASLKCHLKAFWYPFDEQNCSVTFGSWTYDDTMIDLQVGEENIQNFIGNKEWKLVSVEQKLFKKKYDCCENKYPSIETQFTIRRKSCKYLFSKALPAVLIVTLGLLTMIIPAPQLELRLVIVSLLLGLAMIDIEFTNIPDSFNALSVFKALNLSVLVGVFVCNCIQIMVMQGSFDLGLLTKLSGLVSSNEKSENLITNVEERYHRTLDKLFTVPLSIVLISTTTFFILIPFF